MPEGQPRILLVPLLTELEWVIKPQLEAWAEVASFDAPGVGAEPAAEVFGRVAIAGRGLIELDRRSWDCCVVVADGLAIPTAVTLAAARQESVDALALGHARLSNYTEGERAPVRREVWEAFHRLLDYDYRAFVRHGLTQLTHGSFGDELAERMIERIPFELAHAAWTSFVEDAEPYDETLRRLNVPLLFAKHEGCLVATDEGFSDAVAAFPDARTLSVPEAPSVSAEFAEALKDFCSGLADVSGANEPIRPKGP